MHSGHYINVTDAMHCNVQWLLSSALTKRTIGIWPPIAHLLVLAVCQCGQARQCWKCQLVSNWSVYCRCEVSFWINNGKHGNNAQHWGSMIILKMTDSRENQTSHFFNEQHFVPTRLRTLLLRRYATNKLYRLKKTTNLSLDDNKTDASGLVEFGQPLFGA